MDRHLAKMAELPPARMAEEQVLNNDAPRPLEDVCVLLEPCEPDADNGAETGSTSAHGRRSSHPLARLGSQPVTPSQPVQPVTPSQPVQPLAVGTRALSANSAGSGRTTRSVTASETAASFKNVRAKLESLVHPRDTDPDFSHRNPDGTCNWMYKTVRHHVRANRALHLAELSADVTAGFVDNNPIKCPNCDAFKQHRYLIYKLATESTDPIWPFQPGNRGLAHMTNKETAKKASESSLLNGMLVGTGVYLH